MKKIIFIFFLALSQFILSQDKGTVTGSLTDKEMDGEPLPFANVFIKGTTIGGTTDLDGNYTISVPAGQQTVVFSFIGYTTIEKIITVKANETIVLNQLLGASEGVALDEIEIKAVVNREKSSALLLEQKKAVVIKESIGADELAKKGVSNAAGAVAKISGVSKQEGSGEVYVRGLGDRYLNTTMNGLPLPSNNVDKKNIDLSLFPSDIIQSVSISKAYDASFYGDFAAGNIDVTSKEYKGKGFFSFDISAGINTNAVSQDNIKSEGTGQFGFYNRYNRNPFAVILSHGIDPVDSGAPINGSIGFSTGKSFNFDNGSKLSLFGTGSFQRNFDFRDGYTANIINGIEKTVFPDSKEYEYSTLTTGMFSAIYKIDDANSIKYTSLFLNSTSDKVGDYGYRGEGRFNDAFINTEQGFFIKNIQFNQDRIYVNQLTGKHSFNNKDGDDKLKLTWGIGYNNVFAHEPDRKRIAFENYQYALDNDDTTNPTFYSNTVFDNQRYFQNITDEELNSRINFEYTASENVKLNFGYNGRYKTRAFDNIRYGYEFLTPIEVTDVNNLNNIFNVNNFTTIYNTDVFNPIEEYNNTTNLPGSFENTYNGELRVSAGYVSTSIKSNDEKWLFVPGIRLEKFNQRITYDVININPNDAGFREADELFFLPSLNIKYAINENQNLRLAFSNTVSVPEFKEAAPFVYEGVNDRIGGNPDLLNDPSFSKVYNLDLKHEWFITRDELLSVTGFFKQINNPVNLVIANDATGTQRFFRTGDKASVYGGEIEFKKSILKNNDDETQLSGGFNFSYMYTTQDLKSSTGLYSVNFDRDSDQLQGASPILANASLNYTPTISENFKPNASLVFSYFSDRIYSLVGSGSTGNIVEKGVETLDFILRNKIGEKWEVNFSAKNITNPTRERFREGQNGSDDITLVKNDNGTNLSLGLKYKF